MKERYNSSLFCLYRYLYNIGVTMKQLKEHIKRIVNEELNKTDVRSIIDSELEDFLKERRFKKMVREITADVIDDFFQQMWHKKGFWKTTLKNG